jgi:UDP-N-acetylglucosamine--N-acetylmuramyl-(pentapeptide) pyrophosphoryl-undecaprenol N-acetylglucosamine transferase
MNYRPGIVTRLLSRGASAVAVAYPGTGGFLSRKARVVVTGVPVRPEIRSLEDPDKMEKAKREAVERFNLEGERRNILIFGGSQGSGALNRAVWSTAGEVADRADLRLIHITGKRDYGKAGREELERELDGRELSYISIEYLEEMELAYSLADVACCRSGAGTVAELVSAALPAVLVPFPFATDDHQERNALMMAELGAVTVVLQEGDSAEAALREAVRLVDDEEELARMRKACRAAGTRDGARGIAAIMAESQKEGSSGGSDG